MYGNKAVTNIIYPVQHRRADNGTLNCGFRSADYFGATEKRWILDIKVLGSYVYLLYFHYLWLSTWYNIDDTKAAG